MLAGANRVTHGGHTLKYEGRARYDGNPMAEEMATVARHRDASTPDILSKRGGVFWGMVLVLIGGLWFLQAMDMINLGDKFTDAVLPLLLIIAGMYLLAMKVGR